MGAALEIWGRSRRTPEILKTPKMLDRCVFSPNFWQCARLSLSLPGIMSITFSIQHKAPDSKARAGELHTDHGIIHTPIFMPVGTAATVKGLFHRDVKEEAGAEIILANTYHLYLRPGMDIIERAGGVHRFSTWDGPMLTDSGGFQVFSLAACRKL